MIDKTKAPQGDLVIPAEFQLVSFWTIDNPNKDNELELRIEIVDPTGKVLNGFENKYPVKKTEPSVFNTVSYTFILNICFKH